MMISGLQKFSLLDYPEKTCAIVFTSGCNFRCPFCHNPALAENEHVVPAATEAEFFEFLARRRGLLDGICVTGGEPLLHADLAAFLHRVRQLGFLIKLDTNGSLPDALEAVLQDSLVDYIAMDIKNSKEKYAATTGMQTPPLTDIERSVEIIRRSSLDYEFRTTFVREFHTRADVAAMGQWLRGSRRYCLQTFHARTELLSSSPMHAFSFEEMLELKTIAAMYFTEVEIRN
ncbi:MAG: anaerobic ribonucleoside-triphosphate reductase activating protein [Planctomycetia bacterium]|nr:anaerobic ribonucleoside-triphosphate reductase activating protein [Planctomycetia bacterium]